MALSAGAARPRAAMARPHRADASVGSECVAVASGAVRRWRRARPGRRPVSGLASLGRPPSHRVAPRSTSDATVAYWAARTRLPLRGQLRVGATKFRAAPHSRFTRREGFAADTCVPEFYRRSCGRAREPSAGPARRVAAPCYNLRPFNDFRPLRMTTGPGASAVTHKLYIRTFGCQMNEYDSDKMADVLAADGGFALTDRPENADVILFNTCSVREKAQERVFHDLGRVRALKAEQAGSHHRRRRLRREPGRRRHRRRAPRTSTSCSARRRCIGCPRSSARAARRARRRSTSRFPPSRNSTSCRRRGSKARRRSCRSWRAAASTARSASCPTRAARKSRGRSTTC